MTDTARTARAGLPERPSLDGLEEKWARRWQEEGTYTFDRSKERADVQGLEQGRTHARRPHAFRFCTYERV